MLKNVDFISIFEIIWFWSIFSKKYRFKYKSLKNLDSSHTFWKFSVIVIIVEKFQFIKICEKFTKISISVKISKNLDFSWNFGKKFDVQLFEKSQLQCMY